MAGSDANWGGTANEPNNWPWVTYFSGADETQHSLECPLSVANGDTPATVAHTLVNSFNKVGSRENPPSPYTAEFVGPATVRFLGAPVDYMTLDGTTVAEPPSQPTPMGGLNVLEVAPA